MHRRFLTYSLVAVALAGMAGCSSVKMGAACYLPYGTQSSCTVMTTPGPGGYAAPGG